MLEFTFVLVCIFVFCFCFVFVVWVLWFTSTWFDLVLIFRTYVVWLVVYDTGCLSKLLVYFRLCLYLLFWFYVVYLWVCFTCWFLMFGGFVCVEFDFLLCLNFGWFGVFVLFWIGLFDFCDFILFGLGWWRCVLLGCFVILGFVGLVAIFGCLVWDYGFWLWGLDWTCAVWVWLLFVDCFNWFCVVG